MIPAAHKDALLIKFISSSKPDKLALAEAHELRISLQKRFENDPSLNGCSVWSDDPLREVRHVCAWLLAAAQYTQVVIVGGRGRREILCAHVLIQVVLRTMFSHDSLRRSWQLCVTAWSSLQSLNRAHASPIPILIVHVGVHVTSRAA